MARGDCLHLCTHPLSSRSCIHSSRRFCMLHRSLDLYPLLIVDNKPATVWLVGEVDSSWFKLRGEPLAISTGSGEYASVEAFQDVFDADTKFGPRNTMRQMHATDIHKNDLVLVECNVTRWRVNAKGKASYEKGWTKWRTGFELVTIAHLYDGPQEIRAVVPRAEVSSFI
ncbi:hypothetical protein BKA93DRAFT_21342 [Sparassis latifolia]